jgi:hypothetical protein
MYEIIKKIGIVHSVSDPELQFYRMQLRSLNANHLSQKSAQVFVQQSNHDLDPDPNPE